jgi:hypothetical protein
MSGDWTPLSRASSRTAHTHLAHGEKGCRGCRWFETKLSIRGDEYKLEIIGRSIVDGEVDRIRTETTTSAHAVIDFLTLGGPGARYIPKVSRMVLHEAADRDEAIAEALDDFDTMTAVGRHPSNG